MIFKKIIAVVICLLCVSFSLSAQSEDWYYGKPIKFISFEGLSAVESTELQPYTESYIDKPFDDELYLEILNAIYSLEYFEDISAEVKPADADGLTLNLEFTVVEYPSIRDIVFIGNNKVHNSELKEGITLAKGDVFIERKVSVNERRLRDLYLEKGYTDVRVSSTVEETDKGIKITFEINEGNQSVVSRIDFEGNDVFASKTLKKQCTLKEATLFQKGAFKESSLEIDKQNLIAYYQNRGYIKAEITEVRQESVYNEDKDQNELTLTFVINEGNLYRYSGITFEGNHIFETDRLTSLISLKEGDVFNKEKFEESIQAVFNLYLENGYISNGFDYQLQEDAENDTISCLMTIVERDRGHIESITLIGNTKTKDYVILRELGIQTGDIYSKTDIENGLRNLYNTQYFSAIVPDFAQGSEYNLIDMTMTVEEAQTANIEFGVAFTGISNVHEMPVSAFVNLTDSNFGGTGKTISTKFTVSSSEQSISLGYDDSWLMGKPVNISLSVYLANATKSCLQKMYLMSGLDEESYYMDYNELTLGASGALGKRWSPHFAMVTVMGGVSTDFIRNTYDSTLFTPVDATVSKNLNSWGIKNGVWGSVSLDDRDIYYDPSKGWFFSQKVGVYGLLPDIETEYYVQSDTKAEFYATLCDFPLTDVYDMKLVFAFYTGLSFIEELKPNSLSSANMLYIDGMFNGRGWNTLFGLRGKAMWSSYAEIRHPMVPGIFAVDFFFDAVAVKNDLSDMMSNLKIEDFYFSYGPGMRFSIPQFPLRLLLANTFQIKNGKADYNTKWSVTLSFNLPNR